jgi:hypothetical protein
MRPRRIRRTIWGSVGPPRAQPLEVHFDRPLYQTVCLLTSVADDTNTGQIGRIRSPCALSRLLENHVVSYRCSASICRRIFFKVPAAHRPHRVRPASHGPAVCLEKKKPRRSEVFDGGPSWVRTRDLMLIKNKGRPRKVESERETVLHRTHYLHVVHSLGGTLGGTYRNLWRYALPVALHAFCAVRFRVKHPQRSRAVLATVRRGAESWQPDRRA